MHPELAMLLASANYSAAMNRVLLFVRKLSGLDDTEYLPFPKSQLRWKVRAGVVIIAALVVVVVGIGISFVTNATHSQELPEELQSSAQTQSSTEIYSQKTVLTVQLTGGVAQPGIYSLPEGSRVIDAIMAAGGVLDGVDDCGVNLAREIRDGEQIALGNSCGSDSDNTSGLVSLNDATATELDSLPGIGPTLAERILSWRESNGGFSTVEQLNEVPGIGDKLFSGLSELVTL